MTFITTATDQLLEQATVVCDNLFTELHKFNPVALIGATAFITYACVHLNHMHSDDF
uniref:Uncharacterized protein n=1 Tax=Caenorhabditis japonica TaxID=281687 RepID=A0A8R1IX58_CAEJA